MFCVLYNKAEPSRKLFAQFAWDQNTVGFICLRDDNVSWREWYPFGSVKESRHRLHLYSNKYLLPWPFCVASWNFFLEVHVRSKKSVFPLSKREVNNLKWDWKTVFQLEKNSSWLCPFQSFSEFYKCPCIVLLITWL